MSTVEGIELAKASTSSQMAPLEHLPAEVFEAIFLYLEVRDKGRVARVCRAWRDGVYQPSLWRDVRVDLRPEQPDSEIFPSLIVRHIRRVLMTSQLGMLEVARGLPCLRSLDISECCNVTDLTISVSLLKEMPQLTELNVGNCRGITNETVKMIVENLTNLVSLDVNGCKLLTDAALAFIAGGLVRLQHLYVGGCERITNLGVGHLAGSGVDRPASLANSEVQQLRTLDLSLSKVTDVGMEHLKRMTHLRRLVLTACDIITDLAMLHLASVASLRELTLTACQISDRGLACLANGGSQIDNLDLSGLAPLEISNLNISNEGLRHLARMSNLRELSVSCCHHITDEGLVFLSGGQARITVLDVRGSHKIGPEGIVHVSRALTELRVLKVNRRQVSDEGLTTAARHLLKLHTLLVDGENKIEDVIRLRN